MIGPFSRATPGRSVNVFWAWLTDRYCGLRPVDPFSSNVTERPRLFGTLCTRERSDDGLTCKGRPAVTRPRSRPSLLPFEAIRTAQRTEDPREPPVPSPPELAPRRDRGGVCSFGPPRVANARWLRPQDARPRSSGSSGQFEERRQAANRTVASAGRAPAQHQSGSRFPPSARCPGSTCRGAGETSSTAATKRAAEDDDRTEKLSLIHI